MGKKFELSHIVSLLKKGKRAKDIAKDLGISNSNLSYYLGKLKKQNIIKYKGHGNWEVQKSVPTPYSNKQENSRGHAFIWKIELPRKIDWKKHLGKKISYKTQSSGKVIRILLNNRKIWLTKEGMIIYEPFDYFGNNSYEAKGRAVFEMDRLIKKLFSKLKLKKVSYKFTTSREHFALVKNELARQYNKKGEKMYIKSEEGSCWMWIDKSKGVDELENDNVGVNKKVQDYWNDHKKHKFNVTPTLLMTVLNEHNNQIGQVVNNQEVFDRNISLHQEVLREIRDAVRELKEEVRKKANSSV